MPAPRKTKECKTHHVIISGRDPYTSRLIPIGGVLVQICRLEYALDGSSNYIAWKDCMEAVLEDNDLNDFIDQEVPKLTYATQLA